MKMYHLSKANLLTILASIYLSGCSPLIIKDGIVQKNLSNSERNILPTSHDKQAELYEKILLAKIAEGRQAYSQALEFYIAALTIRVDPEIAREALILSKQQDDSESALQIANLWLKFQPDALMPLKVMVFYNLSQQQITKAQAGIEKIIQLETNISEQITFFDQISAEPNQAQVLELLQTLAAQQPDNRTLALAMARIYQQRKDWLKALTLSAQVVELEPDLLISWQYHGSLLINSGAKLAAIEWYKKALLQFVNSNEIHQNLGQLYYDLDRFLEAREQFEKIAEQSPSDSEAQYMIAACYFAEDNYLLSRQYFEPLLRIKRHRNPVLFYLGEMARRESDTNLAINLYRQINPSRYYQTAHSLVARLMQEQGNYQQALDYLESIPPLDEASAAEFKLTRLRLMHFQGNSEQADILLNDVLEQHKNILDVQLYRFQWMIEKGEAQNIPKLIPEVLIHLPDADHKGLILSLASMLQNADIMSLAIKIINNQLTENEDTDYRYMRALLAANSDDIDLAESDLRFILDANPDNIDALNALGYTLADANKNLPEAEQMILRAYQSNPDSAAIVDSMGWVLFRLGRSTEALEYLQRAFQIEASDEIAAHLSEVLWQLDKKSSAKAILSTAIKETPDSKVIKRMMKKLNIEIEQLPSKS